MRSDSLLEGVTDIWESPIHFYGLETWVNQIPVQFFLYNNPNWTWFTQFPNPN